MGDIEIKLKALILNRYKSILDFAKSINMPYSTIDSIFKRGVINANINNIIKICNALGIDAERLAAGEIIASTTSNNDNQVILIARGGEKIQYELTDAEKQAIIAVLDAMKKDK